MTPGPALPCPRCQRLLGPESWIVAHDGVCLHCRTGFEFVGFPALTAVRSVVAPQAAVLAADSVCFFHAENRAEAICDGCGRLLCPVCTVPFVGRKLCPACIAATRQSSAPVAVRSRVLYDTIALAMALVPILLWPFTVLTSPVALGLVIHGWKQPNSLVRGRGRGRLITAGVLAVIQISAWTAFFLSLWLKRK